MNNLTITEKSGDNFIMLTLAGSINSYTYHEFESKIYDLIKTDSIVLDMAYVTNLSSSGLGVLMAATEDGQESGNIIYILNPSDIVKLAIDSTGFSDMFKIIHSLNDIT